MPIPRRLHHIWVGPRPVPESWALPWRRRHARWDYRLWREPDIEPILPAGLRRAWDFYVGSARWHGAADVARVAILLREGGVYVDIDSEPVRSLDGAPFMRGTFFAGLEFGTPEAIIWVSNGTIGAEPDHPIMRRHAELITAADRLLPPWQTVGGGFLTRAVLDNRDVSSIAILPKRAFCPEDKHGAPAPGRSRIYVRQYWATTHRLYGHEGESWQNLARRRRGEEPVPPLRVRVERAWHGSVGRIRSRLRANIGRKRLRRLFRRAVPLPVRRVGQALLRLLRPGRSG